jgi:hypothetical protein
MVEPVADLRFRDALEVFEIDHHIVELAFAQGYRYVYPICMAVQILAKPLVIGENMRRVELDRFGYRYHVKAPISAPTPP